MFDSVLSFFQRIADWFVDWFLDALKWFVSFIFKTFFYLYDKFLTFFQDIIVNFPVPDAWANINPWSGFSGQILYLLDKFRIVEVLAILAAAWSIRFMLNRIPFLKI